MAFATYDFDKISIGRDFVDCVTSKPKCHGFIKVNGKDKEFKWQSTLKMTETETILRNMARKENRRVTYFMSQAV